MNRKIRLKPLKSFRLKDKKPRIKLKSFHLDRKIYALSEKAKKATIPVLILAFLVIFIVAVFIIQAYAPEIIINPKAYIPYELPEDPANSQVKEVNLRLQDQRYGLQQYEEVTGKQRNLMNMSVLFLLIVLWGILIEYRRIYLPYGWGKT